MLLQSNPTLFNLLLRLFQPWESLPAGSWAPLPGPFLLSQSMSLLSAATRGSRLILSFSCPSPTCLLEVLCSFYWRMVFRNHDWVTEGAPSHGQAIIFDFFFSCINIQRHDCGPQDPDFTFEEKLLGNNTHGKSQLPFSHCAYISWEFLPGFWAQKQTYWN